MMVWAFNRANTELKQKLISESLRAGKSRFGWSQLDEHNLLLDNNWTDNHSKQLFLKEIQPGDWIVHINTPSYGKCIAGEVNSTYQFDDGLSIGDSVDFRHYFEIDKKSVIEFDRNDENILPTVNLKPRQRYHRVYETEDFLKSIHNLRERAVNLHVNESKQEYHLKSETEKYLKEITTLIHKMNRSKDLEIFLAKVFRNIPDVEDVIENGFGWGTDYGADLIVSTKSTIGNLDIENKIVVQVKSFDGEHYSLEAVGQIKTGIEKFSAAAGIIITTAESTAELEAKITEIADSIGVPIELIAGDDVAKFVMKYSSELLFRL